MRVFSNIICFLFCCCIKYTAQIALPNNLTFDSLNYQFGLNGQQDIQANSLKNEFTSYFTKGGHIPNELIEKTIYNQHEINRLGKLLIGDIYYIDFKHSPFKRFGIMAEFGYNSISSGIYGKDIFALTFQGNKKFIGDTVKLGGTGFQYIDFQNFGVGLMDKKSKSYATLNLISLQNYSSGDVLDGYIYFKGDSTEIEVNARGKGYYTDTRFSNGIGATINICYNVELPWLNEKQAFYQFQIKNFGFVQSKQLNTVEMDTLINFQGFQLDDFIKETATDVNLLDTLHIKRGKSKKTLFLPTQILLAKVLNANYEGKFQSLFGIIIYPTIHFIPKVYAGLDYKLNKNLHLGNTYSIGGFGNFRGGIYVNYSTKKINLGIGTEDIYGLISKKGFGNMLTFRLLCTI